MNSVPDPLLAFAEDPIALLGLDPGDERILTARYCVAFSPGSQSWSTIVERLRLTTDEVHSGVSEIRTLMVARGRTAATWRVGPSATPKGLVDLLLAMGMDSESEEDTVILILREPPQARPSPFDVRLVSTFDEHLAAIEVGNQGFEFPAADAADERRRARATFESEQTGGTSVRLVAFDGDRPVATGRAFFSPVGLYLVGGATLPSDRRRGAITAIVATAWEEAVRRDTPVLVTLGGRMAAPTLERLGFLPVGRVRHLVDRIPED
jgi:GNAT superfamily N-acetyltransferase